ncbi:hypothetical protein BDV96DRAFT_377666 [Lophiotrema nucula]|uniref:Peptidase metallopeptidase domain-containing protein n=1 Tax=Lophiotrema nucula TaxID=690887 RepID=A0A6A5ZF45_9PLEO|nr:hypothetical protein BDV96DRAFT_377666 [Lophiotrema nucula]
MKLPFVVLLSAVTSCVSQSTVDSAPIRTISLIPSATPTLVHSHPWRHNRTRQSQHVHEFFRLFGWLRRNDTIRDSDMPAAIQKIQKILHEPETGEYDDRMDAVMSKPRCGTLQPYNETDAKSNSTMHKKYVLWGPKWDHTTITYQFINYTADLPADRQRIIISYAFAQWTQYLPITITPSAANAPHADIHIRFMSMGPNETAYAFTNLIADGTSLSTGLINITFNDDWNWTDDRMFNFTATHEIGHSLGLSHSKVEDAVMWPYYEADIRPMHPDDQAAVHSLYGWKNPRWKRIDNNSTTKSIVQLSSNSTTPALLDGLYQMRSSGQILRFDTPSGTWASVDNNKDTIQIAGAGGALYQRHTDGSIYRYTPTSSSTWQYIGPSSDNPIDIVAAADQIYQRRKDGWIARWSGSGTTWNTIEQPSVNSKQIAVTESKTLWNLLSSGDVVRSEWPYGGGWTIVDQNAANSAIAVGGEEFYKLQTDGSVVWLDMSVPYWRIIENAGSAAIYAAGKYLYSRHGDGSIWRYTGTQLVWEQLDGSVNSVAVVGDRRGAVWELLGTGDVLRLVS